MDVFLGITGIAMMSAIIPGSIVSDLVSIPKSLAAFEVAA